MSQLNKHHEELDERGIGKCSVPMWGGMGMPAGFCDEPAYGKPDPCEVYCDRQGQRRKLRGGYDGYVPALACPAHGGPTSRVFMDGNAYCAVLPDFENIQESPCGFGDTSKEARAELERDQSAGTAATSGGEGE